VTKNAARAGTFTLTLKPSKAARERKVKAKLVVTLAPLRALRRLTGGAGGPGRGCCSRWPSDSSDRRDHQRPPRYECPLGGVVASTLYQGMVVSLVSDVQDGRRDHSVGELIEATWPVVLPLIVAGILAGLGIAFGFLLLLVIPGLFLLTIWAVIAPVIVVEHSGAVDAFGRSRELVKGNG
jgi:hypothetical protein